MDNLPKNEVPATTSPDTSSLIAKADAVAARMEAANKVAEELLRRQEEILARNMLSGRAEAGSVVRIESDDEKYKREAKERYKGTGLDPTKGY